MITTLTSRNNVISIGHLSVVLEVYPLVWVRDTVAKVFPINQFSH
jgi:hypothetical protein